MAKQIEQFKVGDKVRILPSAADIGVDKSEIGKIGVIFQIESPDRILIQTSFTKGWFWEVHSRDIIPVIAKGQQLLFNFMKD